MSSTAVFLGFSAVIWLYRPTQTCVDRAWKSITPCRNYYVVYPKIILNAVVYSRGTVEVFEVTDEV